MEPDCNGTAVAVLYIAPEVAGSSMPICADVSRPGGYTIARRGPTPWLDHQLGAGVRRYRALTGRIASAVGKRDGAAKGTFDLRNALTVRCWQQ
jgi:hypothetical protein